MAAATHENSIRVPQFGSEEVFAREADAVALTELSVRSSPEGVDQGIEWGIVVDSPSILADNVTHRTGCRDSESGSAIIADVDVESFACAKGHWHILGFGTDRAAVVAVTERTRVETMQKEMPAAVLPERHVRRVRPVRAIAALGAWSLSRTSYPPPADGEL